MGGKIFLPLILGLLVIFLCGNNVRSSTIDKVEFPTKMGPQRVFDLCSPLRNCLPGICRITCGLRMLHSHCAADDICCCQQ
ncbi:unnamed protein product [Amaranthus hypochondriacus]